MADADRGRFDLRDGGLEIRFDLAVGDAVFDVGQYPVFNRAAKLMAAMDHRHARAVTVEIERGDGRRISPTDDRHVTVIKRMRVFVIVRDLRQIFAWNVKRVGVVVVADGDYDLARTIPPLFARQRRLGLDQKMSIRTGGIGGIDIIDRAGHPRDLFILIDAQSVGIDDAAIIFQSLDAYRFFALADERKVADFEQLGRGEENQLRRVVVERIDDAAFFERQATEPRPLSLDRAGQATGPSADDDDVERFNLSRHLFR